MINKKNKLYIMCLIITLLVAYICYRFITYSDNKEYLNVENDKKNNIVEFDNVEIDVAKNSQLDKMFNKLFEYGEKIYATGEYTNFEIFNDMYFISLKGINERYNYNISMFVGEDGTTCNVNMSGVYFDIDYKIAKNKNSPVIPSLVGCSKNEVRGN